MKHHNQFDDAQDFQDSYEFNDEIDFDSLQSRRRVEIKRKLEERIEKRRLKHELEDYEGELDDDFNWDDYDQS